MQINVLEYLEKTAARMPEKTALTDDAESFSYAETLCMAKRIGTSLLGQITNGQPVGIFMEKCARTVAVFFGVAEAGGCYCVLNNELPPVRLNQIAEVLSPALIVTTEALKQQAQEIFPGRKLLTLEAMLEVPADEAELKVRRSRAIDTDPLYINFTSGSTGVPKGILVAHRSVIDFIDCFTELFSITHADVIANQAPFDFDVSVKDIYSAIAVGATLAVIPRKLFSIPTALVDFLDEKGTTTMIWAVSALCLLTTFHALDYKTPATIRKILFSGEVMPLKALREFRKHLPDATYVNVYGPTEITCNCTYHVLEKDRDYAAGIPIGIPFPNEDVFLLDGENRRVEEADTEGLTSVEYIPGVRRLETGEVKEAFVDNSERIGHRTTRLLADDYLGGGLRLILVRSRDLRFEVALRRIDSHWSKTIHTDRHVVERLAVWLDERYTYIYIRRHLLGSFEGDLGTLLLARIGIEIEDM